MDGNQTLSECQQIDILFVKYFKLVYNFHMEINHYYAIIIITVITIDVNITCSER